MEEAAASQGFVNHLKTGRYSACLDHDLKGLLGKCLDWAASMKGSSGPEAEEVLPQDQLWLCLQKVQNHGWGSGCVHCQESGLVFLGSFNLLQLKIQASSEQNRSR